MRELLSRNPATGELLGRAPICLPEEVMQAVARARRAQEGWGALSVRQRASAMKRIGRTLVRRSDEVALLEVAEQGKNQVEAYGAILNTIHLLSYLRRNAPRVLRTRRVFPLFGMTRAHRIVREPLGVVGVIAPWNYPVTLSLEPIFAAIIAGNAVVLKPSERASQVGLKVGDLFGEAGLPEDLVQVVTGDASTGAALIRAGINKLVFTGSAENGRRVAALAGEHLVPVTLELGGKDAAIVLEDAEIERAALGIAWGGSLNAGQACLAIECVFVIDSIAERFTQRLTEEMRKLRVGPGASADTDVGAITTETQLARIESHIRDATAKGAKLACGGKRLSRQGRFYEPTVLTNVTDDMLVMQEETFGPVIAIRAVASEEEAVERVNASRFGLTCSIWTRNRRRGRRLATRIRAGDVAINEHGAPTGHAEIPWGGVKDSGFGKTRGEDGLLEMVVSKHVSWPRVATRREFYWYPYSLKMITWLRRAVRLLYGTWRDRLGVLLGGPVGSSRSSQINGEIDGDTH